MSKTKMHINFISLHHEKTFNEWPYFSTIFSLQFSMFSMAMKSNFAGRKSHKYQIINNGNPTHTIKRQKTKHN
jgi:hypothetical protein